MAMTNVFYALWAISAAGKYFIWTVPAVFLICLRYCMDIGKDDSDGDPVEVVLDDKALIVMCLIYVFSATVLLYI